MNNGRKKRTGIMLGLFILILAAAAGCVYSHFGGFGTGESADAAQFGQYATEVSKLTVPEGVRAAAA